MRYFPRKTRSLSSRSVDPSKGNEPLTNVYKMTPSDQTSTSGPSYFFPVNRGRKANIYNVTCAIFSSSLHLMRKIIQPFTLEEFGRRIGRTSAKRIQLAPRREFVTESEVGNFNIHFTIQ